jgi:hypothetical protein
MLFEEVASKSSRRKRAVGFQRFQGKAFDGAVSVSFSGKALCKASPENYKSVLAGQLASTQGRLDSLDFTSSLLPKECELRAWEECSHLFNVVKKSRLHHDRVRLGSVNHGVQ